MAYNHRSNYCLTGLILVLALIIYSPPCPVKATSCPEVLGYLMPCQSFLVGIGEITPTCCQGAQALAKAAVTPADRKSVCRCLKQMALSVNVNQEKAKELPKLCNIDVPVPIQPNVNCDALGLSYSLNRYKNMERKAYGPATPRRSPGINHDNLPPHRH